PDELANALTRLGFHEVEDLSPREVAITLASGIRPRMRRVVTLSVPGVPGSDCSRFLRKACLTKRVQQGEAAASSGGEQIDDLLDRGIGTMVGGLEPAFGSVLGIGLMVEAAVGEGAA